MDTIKKLIAMSTVLIISMTSMVSITSAVSKKTPKPPAWSVQYNKIIDNHLDTIISMVNTNPNLGEQGSISANLSVENIKASLNMNYDMATQTAPAKMIAQIALSGDIHQSSGKVLGGDIDMQAKINGTIGHIKRNKLVLDGSLITGDIYSGLQSFISYTSGKYVEIGDMGADISYISPSQAIYQLQNIKQILKKYPIFTSNGGYYKNGKYVYRIKLNKVNLVKVLSQIDILGDTMNLSVSDLADIQMEGTYNTADGVLYIHKLKMGSMQGNARRNSKGFTLNLQNPKATEKHTSKISIGRNNININSYGSDQLHGESYNLVIGIQIDNLKNTNYQVNLNVKSENDPVNIEIKGKSNVYTPSTIDTEVTGDIVRLEDLSNI